MCSTYIGRHRLFSDRHTGQTQALLRQTHRTDTGSSQTDTQDRHRLFSDRHTGQTQALVTQGTYKAASKGYRLSLKGGSEYRVPSSDDSAAVSSSGTLYSG